MTRVIPQELVGHGNSSFSLRRSSHPTASRVTLNLSKSGVSTTIGTRGAHLTFGHGRVCETVGLPGTGLSYTSTQRPGGVRWPVAVVLLALAFAVAWVVEWFVR